jgi:hypothetical protein
VQQTQTGTHNSKPEAKPAKDQQSNKSAFILHVMLCKEHEVKTSEWVK